jgi:voltage-gated potassium channel
MATSRAAVLRERYPFHLNLVGIATCLFLVGFSALAWLHDDLDSALKIWIEFFCCAVLAIDLFINRAELRALLRRSMLRIVTVMAVVPWYTVATVLLRLPDESTMIFLAHASYAPYLYYRFKSYSRDHIAPKAVRIGLVLVLTFFCLHWLASFWMMVQPRDNVDFLTEYNYAMYFLMTTVATVGYGDITPATNFGRFYTMGLEMLGVCMFGIVIGQVSKLIIDADKRKEHAQNQLDSLASLFKHYSIPTDLQKKAYRFLNHILTHASNEDEQKVLGVLPHGLQTELRTYMNMKPISRVSLFKGCSQDCLKEAAEELEQVYFTPGQHIIKKGDHGEEMFLIGHGEVEVCDGDRHIARLGDGACFGEMALLADEKRGADVKASSHCDMFRLSRKRFQHLLSRHGDLQANVELIIRQRKKAG